MYRAADCSMPIGWVLTTLGAVSQCTLGGTPSTDVPQFWNGEIPWMASGDVNLRRVQAVAGRITVAGLAASNATLIHPPAVAVGLAGQGKTRGTVALALCTVCTNQSIALLQGNPDYLQTEFLFHNLDHRYEELRARSSGGGRGGLSKGILDVVPIELPPLSEQHCISKILDTLDTTIRQTEAIIEKLKLLKQGLLHDLLTRGIDANGELRPSQSQAPHLYKDTPLGWIPHEWAAASIRDVASLVTSGSRGWADYYTEAGALFLRSQNVRMGNLDFSDRQHVAPPIGAEGARTKLAAFDLLITITGNGVGNVACVPGNWDELAFVSQHVGLVRLHDPQIAQLAMHFFVGGAPGHQQLIDAQYGQSKPGLSLENLRKFSIPIPPDEERQMIMQRIHGAQDRGDVEQRYAMQLRAMKEGLMDDLLTGRVRVTPLLDTVDA